MVSLTSSLTFLLLSLIPVASARPFVPVLLRLEARASYSVVAVDGGNPGATSAAGVPAAVTTIVQTIVQSAAPATPTTDTIIETIVQSASAIPTTNTIIETVIQSASAASPTTATIISIETDLIPAPTQFVTATMTMMGQNTIQTISITKSGGPATIVVSEVPAPTIETMQTIQIIQTTQTMLQAPTQSLSAMTSSVSCSTTVDLPPSSSISATMSTSLAYVTAVSITSFSTTFPSQAPSPPATTTTMSTVTTSSELAAITLPPTPTKSYDDGQWHTTYPSWSNGTIAARRPRPTLLHFS